MRRLVLVVSCVCACVGGGALAAPAALSETAVGVGEREWGLALYRDRVRPGTVKFNITNFGEDAHDLSVRRAGKVYGTSPEIRSGERLVFRVKLRRRGTYTVFCTIADHERRGMRAKLVVTRKP